MNTILFRGLSRTLPPLLIAFAFSSPSLNGLACPGAKRHAFSILGKNIRVNNPMPSVGDTAWLSFNYRSTYTGPAILHFDFPGSVVPFDQMPGETGRDSLVNVDSGIVYSDSIPFKLASYGASLLQFAVAADSTTSAAFGMARADVDYFEFEFSPSNFQVFADDFQQNQLDSAMDDIIPVGSASCNITGHVMYNDQDQGVLKGVYGADVILLFQRQGQDGSFAHPYTGSINGVLRTAKIDVNGNFSFSFTGPTTWTGYTNVLLFVSRHNDAVQELQTSSSLYLHADAGTPNYPINIPIPAFTLTQGGNVLPVNSPSNINYQNVALLINSADGAIMRDMELSWEFEHARGVAQPGPITVQNASLGPLIAGLFHLEYRFLAPNYAYIQIDPHTGPPFLATVAHEYGHYQNYFNMGPATADDWSGSSRDFVEGFAEFHQFAVRNYAAAVYGEYSPWGDDNQEGDDPCAGPFMSSPRFYRIRYQGNADAPNAAAFSCVLWNVYDLATDNSFRAPQYQGKDNDDVGVTKRVFDVISGWNSEINIGDYMAALFSASPAETFSIYHVYANMLLNVDTLMLPVQVTDVDGMVIDPGPLAVWQIEWQYSNIYGDVCYKNPPTGVHIYQWDGTYQTDGSKTWVLMATKAYPATVAGFNYNPAYQNWFKVSSYNISGDAENAQIINPPAFKINVGGSNSSETAGLDVTVHPNPTSSQARICIADLPPNIPASVLVVNEDGQTVATLYDGTPDAELGLCLTFDCSKLPNGSYYAQVLNAIVGRAVKIAVRH